MNRREQKSLIWYSRREETFIRRVNKCVQFLVGILDLMLILLTIQEWTLTDTQILVFLVALFPFCLPSMHTVIIFFKLWFGASHVSSVLIYIGKVIGVQTLQSKVLSTNLVDFSFVIASSLKALLDNTSWNKEAWSINTPTTNNIETKYLRGKKSPRVASKYGDTELVRGKK